MQVGESVDDAFTICYSWKSIVAVDYLFYREKGFTQLLIGLNVTIKHHVRYVFRKVLT